MLKNIIYIYDVFEFIYANEQIKKKIITFNKKKILLY